MRMEAACDFCGESRATVYCRADSAHLCLLCDRHVHGANALSRRHHRTLLCDACNFRPAAVRCTLENVALCQTCDWDSHGSSLVASQHKRHPFDCFSGCPSAQELVSLWVFGLAGVESRSDAAPPKLAGFSSGSWGAQMSAGPSGAPDALKRSSAAQSLVYSVPNVRASPGKVAAFAAMTGAGAPFLDKSSMPTCTMMMGKGGHGSKQQLSRDEVLQQLQKLEALDPQMQAPMLLQTSKKHPISFLSPPLEPSRAFWHQKQVQQQQPKTPLNQLLSHQQQTANLQNSHSSEVSQLFATSETPQLKSEDCNNSPMRGGDAFWGMRSFQLWEQNMQDLGICKGEEVEDPCEGFSMEDVDLSFDNYKDIFSCTQDLPSSSFEDIHAGCTSLAQDSVEENQSAAHMQSIQESELLEATNGATSGPELRVYEVGLAGQGPGPPLSPEINEIGIMMSATGLNECPEMKMQQLVQQRQTGSSLSLSLSGLSGDSSDYHECTAASSMVINTEFTSPDNGALSHARDLAMLRYKEKKKTRKFDKKIRYESRKARADVRKRVKGRFVKAGQPYDYDPAGPTRSF